MSIIEVKNLTKEFKFPIKESNRSWLSNLVNAKYKKITAVNDISFSVAKGETLAFIGPNGAGKSTTIKMLTGILFPTKGEITVAGYNPSTERTQLSYKIGTVFGQRSQLVFNLPVSESFYLFGKIYALSESKIRSRQAELCDIFEMQDIINQPVRKLSLGQRMRAEVAISLLHEPEIIFLDEPTIGLDIVAKKKLRQTLTRLNQTQGVTLFLTSHDAGDIEALSSRTIIVNQGQIVLDKPTDFIRKQYLSQKQLNFEIEDQSTAIAIEGLSEVERKGKYVWGQVDTQKYPLNDILSKILAKYKLRDINVEDTKLEDIIGNIYQEADHAHS